MKMQYFLSLLFMLKILHLISYVSNTAVGRITEFILKWRWRQRRIVVDKNNNSLGCQTQSGMGVRSGVYMLRVWVVRPCWPNSEAINLLMEIRRPLPRDEGAGVVKNSPSHKIWVLFVSRNVTASLIINLCLLPFLLVLAIDVLF